MGLWEGGQQELRMLEGVSQLLLTQEGRGGRLVQGRVVWSFLFLKIAFKHTLPLFSPHVLL